MQSSRHLPRFFSVFWGRGLVDLWISRWRGRTVRSAVLLIFFAFLFATAVWGQESVGYQTPVIPLEKLEEFQAPILILGDAETGTVLAVKNPDLTLPPASLAKLMTLHLSLLDVEEGVFDPECVYSIPPEGTAASMRCGSSVLGLAEGDKATILTLQRAAAVTSANDAAWSLASLSSGGNVDDFVTRMNAEAGRLGMNGTVYTDPDGWSALSATTGWDQWTLVKTYLNSHPEVLRKIHSLERMEYSESDSLGTMPERKNTNFLLGRYPGVDGLKTGTIPSAGFHFIATANREGTRLLALIMGIKADNFREGLRMRAEEAALLLDLGFTNYETWRAPQPPPVSVSVLHGEIRDVQVIPDSLPNSVTVEKGDTGQIMTHSNLPDFITAPISKGDKVGEISWILDNKVIAETPLVALVSVKRRWRLRDTPAFRNFQREKRQ